MADILVKSKMVSKKAPNFSVYVNHLSPMRFNKNFEVADIMVSPRSVKDHSLGSFTS